MSKRVHYDREVFRQARRDRGLTQSELAAQVGATQSAVSMFEAGKADALAEDTIRAMATAMGIDLPSAGEGRQPARGTAAGVAKFCPAYDCPGNVPFLIGGRVRTLVSPVCALESEPTRCRLCGELLERCCPNAACRAPVAAGAFCARCGTAYIATPPAAESDPAGFVRGRAEDLRSLHALTAFATTLTTGGAVTLREPPCLPPGKEPA
jgi:transcriptional regulator with XRE-family HTH domain